MKHTEFNGHRATVDSETAHKIIRAKEKVIRDLVTTCEKLANEQAPKILTETHEQTKQTLTREINRLKALQQVNPNVREEEIRFFEQQLEALIQAVDSANLRLDAVRVIVAT
ncbi:MAG: hypothetical protein KAR30_10515 [Gammaproteobacteria bacterium]|nr:hypothetical protein [Gammaproteobacteria bacterium]